MQAQLAVLRHQEPLSRERVVVHAEGYVSQHLVCAVFVESLPYQGRVHRLFGVLEVSRVCVLQSFQWIDLQDVAFIAELVDFEAPQVNLEAKRFS